MFVTNLFCYKTNCRATLSQVDTADQLTRLLGPLRRAALRRTRQRAGLPDLPEAQIELLRTLADHGPAGVRETADRLRVAPSTVSNLVRAMSAQDLVSRRTSDTDLRATELATTPQALALLREYDRTGGTVLRDALGRLSAADRATLDRVVPVLAALLAALDDRD
jgi:DNA-binding MarR family transcriptional regulator